MPGSGALFLRVELHSGLSKSILGRTADQCLRGQRLGDTSALALGKQERSVHDFRCYLVDGSSHILFRVEVTAADLEAAKRDAYGILHTKREQSVLPLHGIEIWRGAERLFSSEPEPLQAEKL